MIVIIDDYLFNNLSINYIFNLPIYNLSINLSLNYLFIDSFIEEVSESFSFFR